MNSLFSAFPSISNLSRQLFNIQTASFSKYISKARTKRLPLTTKRVGKGYNKGLGARKEGVLNSKGTLAALFVFISLIVIIFNPNNCTSGKFRKIPEMCTNLIVPDLRDFTLKPYIAVGAKRNVREAVVEIKAK